jgi:hypothetical protein
VIKKTGLIDYSTALGLNSNVTLTTPFLSGRDKQGWITVPAILAYYITPHGFGHAVRSLEVVRHLRICDPNLVILLVSDLPEFIIRQSLGFLPLYRRRRLDVGLVQQDSIRFDLKATRLALEQLRSGQERLIAEELRFFREQRVSAVVSDVAFLPFFAAERADLPCIGLGNFTWDWIYGEYVRFDKAWIDLIGWVREGYRRCGLFLQLPMHGDCSVCPNLRDVPLICRKAARCREETLDVLGCTDSQKNYLISFFDLPLEENALRRIECIPGARFFFKHPLHYRLTNGRSLDPFDLSYVDVVAAMDAVITKPGYGIVADCLAHGAPVVYCDRGEFPEYEVLVTAIHEHLTHAYLSSEDLYAGRWARALAAVACNPRRLPDIRDDGARVCAELILAEIHRSR